MIYSRRDTPEQDRDTTSFGQKTVKRTTSPGPFIPPVTVIFLDYDHISGWDAVARDVRRLNKTEGNNDKAIKLKWFEIYESSPRHYHVHAGLTIKENSSDDVHAGLSVAHATPDVRAKQEVFPRLIRQTRSCLLLVSKGYLDRVETLRYWTIRTTRKTKGAFAPLLVYRWG